jgi:phosphohistidine phosphatase
MLLYLLRHAEAEKVAASDELRQLSKKGERQSEKAARFCERNEIQITSIFSSPILRARQTADIVALRLKKKTIAKSWLTAGMNPDEALRELTGFRRYRSVMIVGHEPDFSRLAAHLLGMPFGDNIRIRKASLTCIQISNFEPKAGALQFMLPVRHM